MTTANLQPVYLNALGLVCALGDSVEQVSSRLFLADFCEDYFTYTDRYSPDLTLPLGIVSCDLPSIEQPEHNSRNNRLLLKAAQQLATTVEQFRGRYGAERIGIIVGTSTSGIAEGEQALAHLTQHRQFPADFDYALQEMGSPANFLSSLWGIHGPAWSVSTACTSGSKALAAAARLLRLGVCDAVIAGGVDTLCKMTVQGFASLQVTSSNRCRPFSRHRDGINIGEGAGLFVLSREPATVRLAGVGETSDAHHISAPDPEGRGAEAAMREALSQAQMSASSIQYLNLHGTGTTQNDKMEALAVSRVMDAATPCSSTKPFTGHTLAASGAIEAAFCYMALQRDDGLLPPHWWDSAADPSLPPMPGLNQRQLPTRLTSAMSNSFAFGGSNTSLIFTAEPF